MADIRGQMRAAHPHRAVVEVGERVLDAEHDFLQDRVPASTGLWQQVAALLVARALQLQRTVLDGATIGYAEELQPTARAMMSTVLALVAIGHGARHSDRERRAVRYLTFGEKARKRRLRYEAQSRFITPAHRRTADADDTAEVTKLLADAKRGGIEPLRMGPNERFWSGYDDAGLFAAMGLKRWYHHYYSPWSDESHGRPRALVAASEQLHDKGAFEIGPQHRSPWFVLFATSEFGVQTLSQVNTLHRLGQRARIKALWLDTQRQFSEVLAKSPK